METSVQQIMIGTISNNYEQALNTLNSIKSFGYDGIELNSFMIKPTSFLVKMLTKMAKMPTGNGGKLNWVELVNKANIKVTALHSDLNSLKNNFDDVVKNAKELNTNYIVITGMYRFDYTNKEKINELCNDLNSIGKKLKEVNLSLLYHNHNVEFVRLDDGLVFDYMIRNLDAKYVNFELDIYWATSAGVNVIELIENLQDRIKLVHLNDLGNNAKPPFMTPIIKYNACELNHGSINIDAIIQRAQKYGVETFILEQHNNFVDNSPIKSIKISSEFLNRYK